MEKELISVFSEYWHAIVKKFPDIILSVVLVLVFIFIARKAGKITYNRLQHSTKDRLLSNFVSNLVKYGLIIFGFLISMNILGLTLMAGGIITGASVSAVILGFAFKSIGENFLAGFILAFKRPFKIGDLIEVDGMQGNITSIDFRTTNIKTPDGVDIFIPNSSLMVNPLLNYTYDTKRRFNFIIQIDYDYDTKTIKNLINESVAKTPEVLKDPPPLVLIDQLASNVDVKVYYWIETSETLRNILIIKSEVIENTKNILSENGYSIASVSSIKLTNESVSVKVQS